MVDATDLKSVVSNDMLVRVQSPVPSLIPVNFFGGRGGTVDTSVSKTDANSMGVRVSPPLPTFIPLRNPNGIVEVFNIRKLM